MSNDADPKCVVRDNPITALIQAAVVGSISAIASDVFVAVLAALKSMNFQKLQKDSDAIARRKVLLWRIRQQVFWIALVGYCFLSTYIIMCFLANVTEADGLDWLASAGFTLLEDFVIGPLVVAFALTCLASLAIMCRPSIREKICKTRESEWLRGMASVKIDDIQLEDHMKSQLEEEFEPLDDDNKDEDSEDDNVGPVGNRMSVQDVAGVIMHEGPPNNAFPDAGIANVSGFDKDEPLKKEPRLVGIARICSFDEDTLRAMEMATLQETWPAPPVLRADDDGCEDFPDEAFQDFQDYELDSSADIVESRV
eukprot:gb/GFBE01039885.1/.p1 GENE.gb/GFBE01039885.1/~~gb/GFBE01039885.1/.p1  ORF type:complete len:311 (+),score=62.23 gb/GFBE01039885.1/:1-933(+)